MPETETRDPGATRAAFVFQLIEQTKSETRDSAVRGNRLDLRRSSAGPG